MKNKNPLTELIRKMIVIETKHPDHTEHRLTQEKMNVEIIRRILSEKKTRLELLRNTDWKTVKVETETKN